MIIDNYTALEKFCKDLKKEKYIGIDTEFVRETTYYPLLCLIQIASSKGKFLIDPLAIEDLSPLAKILANKRIIKIFHSAMQDFNVFYYKFRALPKAVFDTQIAASALGYGDEISYAKLVKKICGDNINKDSKLSRWDKRPLTDKQMNYALADVEHLEEIYLTLKAEIKKQKRQKWIAEEVETLYDIARHHTDPKFAWQKTRLKDIKPEYIKNIMALAEFRENKAQSLNKPRRYILADDTMQQFAFHPPKSIEDIKSDRILSRRISTGFGLEVIDALKNAEAPSHKAKPAQKAEVQKELLALLKFLLKAKSAEYNVAAKLIANNSDLEEIASLAKPKNKALKGWRKKVFGNDAISLKKGDLAIRHENNSIIFFPVEKR